MKCRMSYIREKKLDDGTLIAMRDICEIVAEITGFCNTEDHVTYPMIEGLEWSPIYEARERWLEC